MTLSVGLRAGAQIQYPATRTVPVTDNYFGTIVADPYRWLEDDNSEETKAWVQAENAVTRAYLDKIPFRAQVKERLEEMWNYPRYSVPFRKGEWLYYYKNDGLQNQSVLYRQQGLSGSPEVFLDPNTLSADGTVSLGSFDLSKTGKYAGYTINRSGSDWEEAFLIDATTGKSLDDHLRWLKFTSLSWKGDEGFYYSRYPVPDSTTQLTGENRFMMVYYHKVGTPQSDDVLIYQDREHPLRTYFAGLTEDNRYLILIASQGTQGVEISYRDLSHPEDTTFHLLIPGFSTEATVVDDDGDRLLVKTNDGAPNYQVVSIDPSHPEKDNWKVIVPERPEALQSASAGGGNLFLDYLKDASSREYQYTYDGKLVREIRLPGIGSAGGFGAERLDTDFFYSYSSFSYPSTIFHYAIQTGESTVFRAPQAKFDPSQFETAQVFFTSKDGTRVPMFLTYKKGMRRDGNNPVLIYGYGGFNISMSPYFSISNAFFLAEGGIYAQVTLRGGAEYGEAWHRAGKGHNKQHVFDDMIGAAEYLVAQHYTNKRKIAIRGGSNGGLLIGACMTQRPDLFKVAIPEVGVMDMLRFQKFTIGWAWAEEYGSSDNKDDFPFLYAYSPYHNLKSGTAYPATLVTTADHDDRVVPGHSFKFAARLQADNVGPNPTLIRIESKAGHGGGKPTSKIIDLEADIWSFVMYNLGMSFQ